MNDKNVRTTALSALIKTFSWFVSLALLGGIIFFGDRNPNNIIISGLIVAATSIFILLYSEKLNQPLIIVVTSIIGALFLSYIVYIEVFTLAYPDYSGAVIKSILFVLYFFEISIGIKKINSKGKELN